MKKEQHKQEQQKPQVEAPTGKEIRVILRVAGKDIRGDRSMSRALSGIMGIGTRLSRILSRVAVKDLEVSDEILLGELSEPQIERLEYILRNPAEFGLPSFMLNRQKDIASGKNMHLIGTDLVFSVKQDVDREKSLFSWRGFRHQYGQKVRGQRTRTTGRKGMTVGVMRKTILAQQKAAAASKGAGPSGTGAGAAAPAAGAEKKSEKPAAKAEEKK